MQKIVVLRNAMGTANEALKLVIASPKRTSMLKHIKIEDSDTSAGLTSFCKTRWTVKAKSLNSLKTNYKHILKLWDESLEEGISNNDLRVRMIGVQSSMYTFDFYFGISLGILVLGQADNLAKTLQNPDLCASEGKLFADNTISTLKNHRTEEKFNSFYEKLLRESQELEISEPKAPRPINPPARFANSNTTRRLPQSAKEYFQSIYFEALDEMVTFLTDRFNQESFKVIANLQDLLLLAARNENYDEKLDFVLNFYQGDFDELALRSQLQSFATAFPKKDNIVLTDLIEYFKSLSKPNFEYLSEVCKVMKLILIPSATNATSERSFSKLRMIKDYLKSTMTQKRLNHFMIFNIYPEYVDQIDIVEVAKEFVSRNENRRRTFGHFE